MFDWLHWFTDMSNTKPFALVLFFITFVAIVVYVYSGKKRTERLESYKNIPLNDDGDESFSRHEDIRK